MTRLIARVVLWLALGSVTIVAGGHTIYYLMTWEWNRASIAGVAFVASLVVIAAMLVMGRLLRVERKIDLLLAGYTTAQEATRPELVAAEVQLEPRPDLPWLSHAPVLVLGIFTFMPGGIIPREPPDAAVFIPVFLAAGLILSTVAAVVERVAAVAQGTKAPTRQQQAGTTRELLRSQPKGRLALIPVAGILVIGALIGGLYWASHYWAEPIGPGVTTMTVVVDARGPTTTELEVVETVGRFCAVDSGTHATFAGVEAGPGDSTFLRLEPLLDQDAQTRYIGCLEDAVLEWHRLTVTETVLQPQ